MLPSDTTAGHNTAEGNRRKSYFDVVIEGVRRKARLFVVDSEFIKLAMNACA